VTDENPHTLIIEIEHAVSCGEWTRALSNIDNLRDDIEGRATDEYVDNTDPSLELTWQDLSDMPLGLSVSDVVTAAESVAEGAHTASNQQYQAGKIDGALAVAELLTRTGDVEADVPVTSDND
jgi:hypothetical protein